MPVTRPTHRRLRSPAWRACSSVVLLLGVLAGCSGNPREQDAAAPEGATVRVENRAWTEMTIYAVAGGQRVRLGSVTSNQTAVLGIPSSIIGFGRSLTFIADPLGSDRTSTSFEIFVQPGEEITLVIPAQAG
jgi:hypothetical protein